MSTLTDLLEEGRLYEVLEHDHREFGWYVSIDDEAAVEYDGLVDELVRELTRLSGVTRAVREDREVVLVAGDVSRLGLESWLQEWWTTKAASLSD